MNADEPLTVDAVAVTHRTLTGLISRGITETERDAIIGALNVLHRFRVRDGIGPKP